MGSTKSLQYEAMLLLLCANLLSWNFSRSHWFRDIAFSLTTCSTATDAVRERRTASLSFAPPIPSRLGEVSTVYDNSSWIGNQWIPPPGFRLYSVEEMQQFFRSQAGFPSMLFIGDSNTRRLYGTFFAILNATTNGSLDSLETWDLDAPDVIDVNKLAITEVCTTKNRSLCRHLTSLDKNINNDSVADISIDLLGASCPEYILDKVNLDRLVQEYSLIVVHIGAWFLMSKCREKRWADFQQLIEKLDRYQQTNLTIVLVTMGTLGYDNDYNGKRSLKKAYAVNSQIRQHVNDIQKQRQHQNHADYLTQPQWNSLTLVDWGSVIYPRSWPLQDRIQGDIVPHYGLEARLVVIQMLMNHLLALYNYDRNPAITLS